MSFCTFVWHDLVTSDTEAAKAFYTDVVGWQTEESGTPDAPYTLLLADGVPVAGIMPFPEDAQGMPPCWTGYIGVPDVDDWTTKVTARGGRQYRAPRDIPGVGRFSVVSDPHGAAFILFKGNGEMAARPFMARGTVGWNELHCGDLGQAWDFYSGLFGWVKGFAHDMGPQYGLYQTFGETGEGPGIGGMMKKMPSTPVPNWTYYFSVGNIGAAAERVLARGGKLLMEPHEVPGGTWIAPGMDPQGAMFALIGLKG